MAQFPKVNFRPRDTLIIEQKQLFDFFHVHRQNELWDNCSCVIYEYLEYKLNIDVKTSKHLVRYCVENLIFNRFSQWK